MHKQIDYDNIKWEHLKILCYISVLFKPLKQFSNPPKAPIRADIGNICHYYDLKNKDKIPKVT